MEVALTFGSVGDLIAICQIAIQLRQALGTASGSAKEYQDLREDVDNFTQILGQVIEEQHEHGRHPSLANLDTQTRNVVNECATLMKDALDRWYPKYHQSLQPGGSGNPVKDAFRKVEWSVREKQGLKELQYGLRKNTERLALLVGITSRYSTHAENATLLAKINEVSMMVSNNQRDQKLLHGALQLQNVENQTRFSDLNRRLEAQTTRMMSAMSILLAIFHELGYVKKFIIAVMLHLRMMSGPLFRGLDPTKGFPVFLEDALGNILEIPLQWLDDWDNLDSLLEMRFKRRRGYQLVKTRHFALEDEWSGDYVNRDIPLIHYLRRGMKVNMTFIFYDNGFRRRCPRCGADVNCGNNTNIQCPGKYCGMWIRSEKPPANDIWVRRAHSKKKEIENAQRNSNPVSNSNPDNSDEDDDFQVAPLPRTPQEPTNDARPSDFQRVRLVNLAGGYGGYQVVERYSACRCVYYEHAPDINPYYGKPGCYLIAQKEVLVGYSCSVHLSQGYAAWLKQCLEHV
ncbi:hypothetical protein PG984_013194 [Apiospora sp. TS-2023a]